MNSEEVIQSALEEMESTKQEETLQQIILIKEKIKNRPVSEWTMDGLVDHVFTLAKVMDNLSEMKDFASLRADATEEEYDFNVTKLYLSFKEDGMTDKTATESAKIKCADIKKRELSAKYQARILSDLYKDCERLINFTQTKIKSLVDSQVRSNIER